MITLTLQEAEIELLDGFPEYVYFDTSIPATVYYTLDGTEPNLSSLIAVDKVYLPTLSGSITVRAIAIAGDDFSEIISAEYYVSNDLDGRRITGNEGIAVMRYGDDPVDSLSYAYDGSSASNIAYDVNDLDIKASQTDSYGVEIKDGKTSREFINFSKKSEPIESPDTSSPNNNPNFDASAKFIIIDGTTNESKENQVVKIVNRAYNTFGTTTNFYKERLGEKQPIVTGNFVKSYYNKNTGKYVSYYWESLESRWIRSDQIIDRKTLNIGLSSEGSFVYRWVQDRSLSQLF